jgi:hypothetical protein
MLLVLALPLTIAGTGPGFEPLDGKPLHDPQLGQSFRIPYRLTDTNHFLVRVRLNGKGPFNFLVDSGAPALYIATETATKIGLKTPRGKFWTPLEHLEIEGGAHLLNVKARVEDPFQLVGMNALGLPGSSIDGILGFTILARFRLEIDPTQDRMRWTRLAFNPADPPIPQAAEEDRNQPSAELQAMNFLGPLAKGLAFLIGKQPEEQRYPRGFLGLEFVSTIARGQATSAESQVYGVQVRSVLESSPAARGGLRPGDNIIRIADKPVTNAQSARSAVALIQPGSEIEFLVNRSDDKEAPKPKRQQVIRITVGEGL